MWETAGGSWEGSSMKGKQRESIVSCPVFRETGRCPSKSGEGAGQEVGVWHAFKARVLVQLAFMDL